MILSNVCRVVLQHTGTTHTYDTWYCYHARVLSFPFLTSGFSQGCYDTARGFDEVVSHNCTVLAKSHRCWYLRCFNLLLKWQSTRTVLCVLAGVTLKASDVGSFSSECASCLSLCWDESHPKARPGPSCGSAAFSCLQNHVSSDHAYMEEVIRVISSMT